MVHRFRTPNPPRLTIEFRSGSVTVRTEDVDETTVDLRGERDDEATRRLISETTIAQRGDEVVVLVPKRKGLLGRSADLVLAVTAPKLATLAIESASADVSVHGEIASSSITTGTGDVVVGHVAGSLRVQSGSGTVRAERIDGDAHVSTGSGRIQLGVVGASASVASGCGDVRIGSGGVSLDVKTGSGDVEIATAPGRISAKTGSGHVLIESIRAGDVRARSASGDIRAGVLDGTAAWLDVRTVTGRVSSDLAAADEPGGEEDRVRLQLETVTGDIAVTRVHDG